MVLKLCHLTPKRFQIAEYEPFIIRKAVGVSRCTPGMWLLCLCLVWEGTSGVFCHFGTSGSSTETLLFQNDLLFLKVTSQLHHLSIKCAIHVLHVNKFNPHCLHRRPADEVRAG